MVRRRAGGRAVSAARPADGSGPRPAGFLATVERLGDRLPDPVLIFLVLIAVVVVLSVVGAGAGWQAVNPVSGQVIAATSLLTPENIERLFVDMSKTLTSFPPLGNVLVVMLGASLAERTGLFAAVMRAAVQVAPQSLLTPIVLFAGIMANQAADAAFVVLPPLAAALYAAAGRHPLLGIAVAFAGVAGGYSANLLPGAFDALLLGITESAAQLLVPGWRMNIAGNWYFIVAMTMVFVPLGWWVTERFVAPRFAPWTGPLAPAGAVAENPAADPAVTAAGERRGLRAALLAAIVVHVLFAALAWPALWAGQPGGAPLFDEAAAVTGGLEQGLRPLFQSLVAAVFVLFLATGVAYGRAAGVNRNHRDEVRMVSAGLNEMSYYIVLAFAAAHFIALFNWSNLGVITAIHGAESLARSGLPAPLLVAGIVVVAASVNLLIGSASAKWAMLAPVLVPMLMLLGISPEMTTAAYRMGDSVTNPITPLMVYTPLALTFCRRWVPSFGLGGLISTMLPYSLAFLAAGLLMVAAWAAFDVPVGPGAGVGYALPSGAPGSGP